MIDEEVFRTTKDLSPINYGQRANVSRIHVTQFTVLKYRRNYDRNYALIK